MDDVEGGGRGRCAAEELILRTVAAHADSLLRTARRYSICTDDAQDAYQRALEIFMNHADRLDAARAGAWLHVVVKREALAIRRSRKKLVGSSEVDLDAHEARRLPTPDEQLLSFDMINRSAEALQRLKPQELRALWLKAQGHSYNDIGAITGWSYTKVNRCLTEGRRSFLERYAGIESGAECRRWMPVISAMVDGEATPEQILELRPHLRNCPGCRATLKALHESSAPLSAVLPIPLAVAATDGGEQISNFFMRMYEAIAGGLHERAVHSATKAQAAIEAAAAGKVAAVAASAAAVAGGGYATVERTVERSMHPEHRDRGQKIAHHDVVAPRRKVVTRLPAAPAASPVPAPAPAPAPAKRQPVAAAQAEFGASGTPVTSGSASGFEPAPPSKPAGAASAAGAAPHRQARPSASKPTPEFATQDAGSEFGP